MVFHLERLIEHNNYLYRYSLPFFLKRAYRDIIISLQTLNLSSFRLIYVCIFRKAKCQTYFAAFENHIYFLGNFPQSEEERKDKSDNIYVRSSLEQPNYLSFMFCNYY